MKKEMIISAVGLCLMASCANKSGQHEISDSLSYGVATDSLDTILSSNDSVERPHQVYSNDISTDTPELEGKWTIENIVFSDEENVRPSEIFDDFQPYIEFKGQSFTLNAGCNKIMGSFSQKGDSIIFGNSIHTAMLCGKMEVEKAMDKILYTLSTIDVENDSIIRINGTVSMEYVVLRKPKELK